MATLQEQLEAAVSSVKTDADKLHDVVHGHSSKVISTENGNIKSVAKALAEIGDTSELANKDLDNLNYLTSLEGLTAINSAYLHSSGIGQSVSVLNSDTDNPLNYTKNASSAKNSGVLSANTSRYSYNTNNTLRSGGIISVGHNSSCTQIFFENSQLWVRHNVYNSWSDWGKIYTQQNQNLVGSIHFFADDTTTPNGFLKCNGAEVERHYSYYQLFDKIGTKYGSGNGSTTFNLPDLRDQFLRCSGTSRTCGSTQDASTGSKGLEDFMEIRIPYASGDQSMHVFAPKRYTHTDYGGATDEYRQDLTATDIGETRPDNIALTAYISY